MCGRYTLTIAPDALATAFNAELPSVPLEPRFNASPTQFLPVMVNQPLKTDLSERQINLFRWGLVPFWTKQLDNRYSMINARAETLADKPSFREALKRRRCLVFSDGFYEWKKESHADSEAQDEQREKSAKSAAKPHKTPMRITLENGQPYAYAGLWETWKITDQVWDQFEKASAFPATQDGLLYSFTVITTAANELMQPIHDRMPVILDQEAQDRWLHGTDDLDDLLGMLKPYASEKMTAYPVSKLVNAPTHDDPRLIEPVSA